MNNWCYVACKCCTSWKIFVPTSGRCGKWMYSAPHTVPGYPKQWNKNWKDSDSRRNWQIQWKTSAGKKLAQPHPQEGPKLKNCRDSIDWDYKNRWYGTVSTSRPGQKAMHSKAVTGLFTKIAAVIQLIWLAPVLVLRPTTCSLHWPFFPSIHWC